MNFLKSICGLTISAVALISIRALALSPMDGWSVTAPAVNGLSTVASPETGYIAFDAVTGAFYGYSGSGWQPMSPTATGQLLSGDGTVSAPAMAFANETNTGMYRVGADQLGFAVDGVLGFGFINGGGFVNVGLGVAPSLSYQFPLMMARTNSSAATTIAVLNPSTDPNSNAAIQVTTDAGNVSGTFAAYTSSSTVPPYISSLVVRAWGASTAHLTLMGGDNAGDDVRVWTNGDFTSTGETASFNGDHSTTLFGLLNLPVQASGVTPTCGTSQKGGVALTNGFILCVCTGTSWVKTADGSTACTF